MHIPYAQEGYASYLNPVQEGLNLMPPVEN